MVAKNNELTIILPICDEPQVVIRFLNKNKKLLTKYPLFIIDKKGGDILKKHASLYRKTSCPLVGWPLASSRRFLINKVQTEFTLCMDVDVLLPDCFVEQAVKKFEDVNVVALALEYEKPQGHLAFGPSMWRTKVLKELYDWNFWKPPCECLYMWNKIKKTNNKLETLDMKATHLKHFGDSITANKTGVYNHLWGTTKILQTKIVSKLKKLC